MIDNSRAIVAFGAVDPNDMPLADETISAGHGKETDIGIADKYVVLIVPCCQSLLLQAASASVASFSKCTV